jgi:ADP-ribose pyrophosphatase YjhB (NUDIX family)
LGKLGAREYPSRPILGVGAVIIRDEKILLVKRRYEPKANYWSLPGGLVELGEEVRQAVIREVSEECGIEIEPTKIIDVIDFIERDELESVRYHYVLIDFEAVYKSGVLTPASDVIDVRWFSKNELENLELPEITKRFLKKHYQI